MRRSILLAFTILANCRHSSVHIPLPAPNPNGCYVMVFDRPDFLGTGDVWNGPGRWSSLEGLRHTRRDGWRNQIRSLRVGTAAVVTIFTDADFSGESRQLPPDSDHSQLDAVFSASIESLRLECR
jgi:peptidase inhibitor family I36